MTTPRARSATSAPGRTSSSAPTRCSCSGPTVRGRASKYNEDEAARRAFALYRDADRAVSGRAGDRSMDLRSLHLPQRLRARLGSHVAGRRVPPAVGRRGVGARTARLGAAGAAHLAPGPGAVVRARAGLRTDASRQRGSLHERCRLCGVGGIRGHVDLLAVPGGAAALGRTSVVDARRTAWYMRLDNAQSHGSSLSSATLSSRTPRRLQNPVTTPNPPPEDF